MMRLHQQNTAVGTLIAVYSLSLNCLLEEKMKSKKSIGLVGLGKMGKNHLRILSSLREIDKIYVFDTDIVAMKALGEKDFIVPVNNLGELLRLVDTIIIASPTSTHYDILKHVIGKIENIFVEKPLCENSFKAKKIVQMCAENRTNIVVGFIERFNPVMNPLKRLFEKPCINADFFRTDGSSSRISDVDVIADLMIHDIDLATYLNGKIVSATGFGKMQHNQIAFACATLKHENGSYSRLTASKLTEKKMRYIDITFDDKFVNCNLLTRDLQIHKQFSARETNAKEFRIGASAEQVLLVPTEPLLSEITEFLKFCDKKGHLKNSILPNQIDACEALNVSDKIRNDIILDTSIKGNLSLIASFPTYTETTENIRKQSRFANDFAI